MGYEWRNAELSSSHNYLLPALRVESEPLLAALKSEQKQLKAFDLGCGNGSVAGAMERWGWSVVGVDPSVDGIAHAKSKNPGINLHVGSAYDDLSNKFGKFPLVYSLEVVEHVYAPREYAQTLFNLMEDDGIAIVSTPYHGYWKNLVMALSGKMDAHFTALWDHGHIKFWSVKTITELFAEVGLKVVRVHRVGRIPVLAKSMVLVLKKN